MKKYALLFLFFMLAGTTALSAQSQANKDDTAGIKDNFALNDAVSMYPNPVENYLTIRSNLPMAMWSLPPLPPVPTPATPR